MTGENTNTLWFWLFLGRIGAYLAIVALTALLIRLLRLIRHKPLSNTQESNLIKTALILALSFDVLSFQYIAYAKRPKLPDDSVPYLSSRFVNNLPFQAERTERPANTRQQHAMKLSTNPANPMAYSHTYSFAQFDPHKTIFGRHNLWTPGVRQLLGTRNRQDRALRRVLGWDTPKLRLVSKAIIVQNDLEAQAIIGRMKDMDKTAVLTQVNGATLPSGANEPQGQCGDLRVTKFNANQLTVEANVTAKKGAWLVYADAFHPGWRATVNGKEVPIAKAYMAFKAVWLEPGHSLVTFRFRYGLCFPISYFIAIFGIAFSFCALAAFFGILLLEVCSLPGNSLRTT